MLARIGVPAPLLARAVAEARWLGVSPDAALMATRQVGEDEFYHAFAQRIGAPFAAHALELDDAIDYGAAADAGLAPLRRSLGRRRWLVAPRGRALAALAALPDASGFVVTTPRRFGAMLRASAARRIARDAAATLAAVEPRLSAARGPSNALRRGFALALLLCVALATIWPQAALSLVWTLMTLAFSAATLTRLFATVAALPGDPPAPPLPDRDLPDYTIVVALYREAAVADALVRALERIDYPRARLDVKFVVEHDDPETYAALVAAIPGAEYEVIVAPPGAPRTKPRALDVALPFARGRLLTVFDAEDEPAPDQLRLAAARFAESGHDLACLQARLAIDNADDNWLTTLYAIDYAALFEAGNPGVAALGLPMLLGGTSNHFRTSVLRAIGGWDAWNVTEDADLGLRLARYGYRVETLASRTYEEAPNALVPFLRQRVRWMKGWMQTAFVHLRDPVALWFNLGPLAFAATLAGFVSGVLSPMLWPFFVVLLARDAASGALFAPADLFSVVVDTFGCWLALAGPVAALWPALLGMKRQGLLRCWPYLLLLPIWYALLCIAAWRAVLDLWRDPHGWAKTTHGVARRRTRPALTAS